MPAAVGLVLTAAPFSKFAAGGAGRAAPEPIGSPVARRWTIAMYSLLALVLLAAFYFYP